MPQIAFSHIDFQNWHQIFAKGLSSSFSFGTGVFYNMLVAIDADVDDDDVVVGFILKQRPKNVWKE